MIYAIPETVMVEMHSNLALPNARVTWLDRQGLLHRSRYMLWGAAHILADKLQHGEAYHA